ncbi:MAG TPA: hypothetical protein VN329_02880, partial [Roseomonas sp.]|nr:hypothetical protein [Roseomonas sp.]
VEVVGGALIATGLSTAGFRRPAFMCAAASSPMAARQILQRVADHGLGQFGQRAQGASHGRGNAADGVQRDERRRLDAGERPAPLDADADRARQTLDRPARRRFRGVSLLGQAEFFEQVG